jgi:hypothetical protein
VDHVVAGSSPVIYPNLKSAIRFSSGILHLLLMDKKSLRTTFGIARFNFFLKTRFSRGVLRLLLVRFQSLGFKTPVSHLARDTKPARASLSAIIGVFDLLFQSTLQDRDTSFQAGHMGSSPVLSPKGGGSSNGRIPAVSHLIRFFWCDGNLGGLAQLVRAFG